jgi:hypothetical protein
MNLNFLFAQFILIFLLELTKSVFFYYLQGKSQKLFSISREIHRMNYNYFFIFDIKKRRSNRYLIYLYNIISIVQIIFASLIIFKAIH